MEHRHTFIPEFKVTLHDTCQRFEMPLKRGRHDVLRDGTIYEGYSNWLGDSEIEKLKTVLKGKNPFVAYLGDKHSIEKQKVKKNIMAAHLETIEKYYELKQ